MEWSHKKTCTNRATIVLPISVFFVVGRRSLRWERRAPEEPRAHATTERRIRFGYHCFSNFVREHSGANFVTSGGERLDFFDCGVPVSVGSECVFSGMLVECLLEDEEVARPLYRRGPKLADLFVERAVEMGPAQRKRGKVRTAKQATRVRDWETWRLSLCTSKATMHLGVSECIGRCYYSNFSRKPSVEIPTCC